YRPGLKARERLQKAVHIGQPWNVVRIETQAANAFKEVLVRIPLPAWRDARKQLAPRLLVFVRVQLIGLLDVELALALSGFDEGCLAGGQTGVCRFQNHPTPPNFILAPHYGGVLLKSAAC